MSKRSPPVLDIFMPSEGVLFDVSAFDGLIQTHAVQFTHYRSMPCPIGVTDLHDIHSHAKHDNCSNGFIYEPAGTVLGFFSGNQTSSTLEELGVMDSSTVQVTLSRFYDETEEEVLVQTYDRFFLKDFEGARTTSQRFEHNQGDSDRLQFPPLRVHDLMDASGNHYKQDVDFVIDGGGIRWVGQRQPGYDPKLEKGEICAVRYSYRPFWYVQRLLHEIRVTKDIDPITGDTKLVRMPHAVLLQREYIFENENRDETKPDARDARGPRKGGFGPR
jgi:hypothetical protein